MFIDADTHVDECADTWSYLSAAERHLAPRTIEFDREEMPSWIGPIGSVRSSVGAGYDSGYFRYWFIDGQLFLRRVRSDERTGTSLATRELADVGQRLKDMDAMGVETQILYPTMFLAEVTQRPEIDVPLCRAYNRWLADRCGDAKGRLRFVAMIPFSSPPDAAAEIAFAKEHGAAGIFKRGVECGGLAASHPHFFGAYAAAEEHDLPVCIHQASAWQPVQRALSMNRQPDDFPLLSAFSSLVAEHVPERFPNLRFGFIEAGSSWVPYLLEVTGANDRKEGLEELHFYVTCEVKEDLAYLASTVGDSNLIVGTDYCHADRASVRDAHVQVEARRDLAEGVAGHLTAENARTFYGL